jgi:hypothetical protein
MPHYPDLFISLAVGLACIYVPLSVSAAFMAGRHWHHVHELLAALDRKRFKHRDQENLETAQFKQSHILRLVSEREELEASKRTYDQRIREIDAEIRRHAEVAQDALSESLTQSRK